MDAPRGLEDRSRIELIDNLIGHARFVSNANVRIRLLTKAAYHLQRIDDEKANQIFERVINEVEERKNGAQIAFVAAHYQTINKEESKKLLVKATSCPSEMGGFKYHEMSLAVLPFDYELAIELAKKNRSANSRDETYYQIVKALAKKNWDASFSLCLKIQTPLIKISALKYLIKTATQEKIPLFVELLQEKIKEPSEGIKILCALFRRFSYLENRNVLLENANCILALLQGRDKEDALYYYVKALQISSQEAMCDNLNKIQDVDRKVALLLRSIRFDANPIAVAEYIFKLKGSFTNDERVILIEETAKKSISKAFALIEFCEEEQRKEFCCLIGKSGDIVEGLSERPSFRSEEEREFYLAGLAENLLPYKNGELTLQLLREIKDRTLVETVLSKAAPLFVGVDNNLAFRLATAIRDEWLRNSALMSIVEAL